MVDGQTRLRIITLADAKRKDRRRSKRASASCESTPKTDATSTVCHDATTQKQAGHRTTTAQREWRPKEWTHDAEARFIGERWFVFCYDVVLCWIGCEIDHLLNTFTSVAYVAAIVTTGGREAASEWRRRRLTAVAEGRSEWE